MRRSIVSKEDLLWSVSRLKSYASGINNFFFSLCVTGTMRPADELRGAAAPVWVLSPPFLHVPHPVSTPLPLAGGHPHCLVPSIQTRAVVQRHPWGGGYALAPADEGGHRGHFPKAAINSAHQAVVPSGPLSEGCSASGCLLKVT